jgi:hypothetical protein
VCLPVNVKNTKRVDTKSCGINQIARAANLNPRKGGTARSLGIN